MYSFLLFSFHYFSPSETKCQPPYVPILGPQGSNLLVLCTKDKEFFLSQNEFYLKYHFCSQSRLTDMVQIYFLCRRDRNLSRSWKTIVKLLSPSSIYYSLPNSRIFGRRGIRAFPSVSVSFTHVSIPPLMCMCHRTAMFWCNKRIYICKLEKKRTI